MLERVGLFGWEISIGSFVLHGLLLIIGIGLGYAVHYLQSHSYRSNFEADERRKMFTEKIPIPDHFQYKSEWLPNSRGALLYRQQLIPNGQVRGVIGICHGFTDHTNSFHTELAIKFCDYGYAVVMLDAEGHGLSDGVFGYIRSIDDIVEDCADFFLDVMSYEIFEKLPFFVYGESMGGAVAFNLCTKSHCSDIIQGIVMVAPMLKISADMMMVPRSVVHFIRDFIVPCIPYAPLAPARDIIPYCYKKKETCRLAQAHSLHFDMKPRLGSAMAMLNATEDIIERLDNLTHRVLIIHGNDDTVTDPSTSSELYDTCQSKDKTLKIYEGCLHGLMKEGDEPRFPEIFGDIIDWLDAHELTKGRKRRRSSLRKKRNVST